VKRKYAAGCCINDPRSRAKAEQLEQAYAQGMALSLEKALDLALGKAGSA
jgi:hypothetical protein